MSRLVLPASLVLLGGIVAVLPGCAAQGGPPEGAGARRQSAVPDLAAALGPDEPLAVGVDAGGVT